MHIVTGASGRLGQAIVHHLVKLVPVFKVVATCRGSDKASEFMPSGIELRRAGTGLLEAPEGGKVAWTARTDLAEAAARVFVSERPPDGPTAPLVGAEELDLGELCAIAATVLTRPCRRAVVSDDEMRERLLLKGVPAPSVEIVLGFYPASRKGEFASRDNTLATLLGRPSMPMREVIETELR